jgi:hypothetical protein
MVKGRTARNIRWRSVSIHNVASLSYCPAIGDVGSVRGLLGPSVGKVRVLALPVP